MAFTYTTSAPAVSLSVTVPAGGTSDVAIIVVEDGDAPSAITGPAGWTNVHNIFSGSGSIRCRAFYKVYTSSSSEAVTCTKTGGASNSVSSCIRIQGVDTTTPLGNATANPVSMTGTSASATSISIASGNDHLIICANDNTGGAWAGPSGSSPTYTEQRDGNGQAYYTGPYATGASTGTRTCTENSGGPGIIWSFEVKAASAAAASPAPRPRRPGIPAAHLNR